MAKKTKPSDTEIKYAVLNDIEKAEDYYAERVQPAIEEAVKIYNADKDYYDEKFPELSKRSRYTTKDVANTVEAVMPDLMRLLLGSDKIVSMKPVGFEDAENNEVMEDLVNHQFMKQNKGYKLTYRWVKASLYKKFGVVKCAWKRDIEWVDNDKTFDLNDPKDWNEYTQIIAMSHEGKIKMGESKEFDNGFFQMKYKTEKVSKNQPEISYMDASEFLFIPMNMEIRESPFTAQKMSKTVSELRIGVKAGLYTQEAVDSAIAKTGNSSSKNYSSTDDTQYQRDKATYDDERTQSANKPIEVYECYGEYDIDGSEILQPMIYTMANGEVIREEKNEMEVSPFFPMMPLLEPDDILGKCMSDLVEDFQHLKIAMIRQLIINTGLSNKPKYFYNSKAINGKFLAEDLEYIPVDAEKNQGINNHVVQEQVVNVAPWTMKLLEYNDQQKQQTSGITDYSMGMGSDLNKSNTKGEAQILNSNGNKRVEMIARNIVETGFVELFSHMVNLNLKYIDKEQVFRITGEQLEKDPSEYNLEYDVMVSSGLGMGSKEQDMQAMQFVGQFFPELAQMLPLFQANPNLFDKWRNQKAKTLEEMGVKDVDSYLPTREEVFPQQQGQPQGQPQPQGMPQGQPQQMPQMANRR